MPEAPLAEVIKRLAARDASLVLLDTRSADERAVSSIPGAIAVPEFEAAPAGTYDGREVVTFCTVRAGVVTRTHTRTRWQLLRHLQARGVT